ncbi:hypothetical protein VOLCADRAFT_118102 [Volvox carteri f. nagariensis]|uniref:UvrD-like helicase ATP-binding domain-containing protein n=1 Tax=Volvox carteri f. nagariensis TaxID=3068 RepID=D8U185_VOLCA|nr:uncharacterized protein VOLCADRAFT_118102 [Volvox carteri f. nagariensis]EFJ46513.1 hypothetical protein VOLCADRAFT_118102 [Volvox carteri f. nagariensis]|eukprot:XP_002952370.1 hypothetical protein VOLCADRAFT_118102 [Volvox carteri f. nagariensis]
MPVRTRYRRAAASEICGGCRAVDFEPSLQNQAMQVVHAAGTLQIRRQMQLPTCFFGYIGKIGCGVQQQPPDMAVQSAASPLPRPPPKPAASAVQAAATACPKSLVRAACGAVRHQNFGELRPALEQLKTCGQPLTRSQAAELVECAAVENIVRLLESPGQCLGDWTLLRWQPAATDNVVYNSLLHEVVLRTYSCTEESEDSDEAQEMLERGLAVVRLICERRPAAVVDFQSRLAGVTPVEALLDKGNTEMDEWLEELLKAVAPLNWVLTKPGWAGQRRALAICDQLVAQPAVAEALGIDPEGWVIRGSLLQAMLDEHLNDPVSLVMMENPERMPRPAASRFIVLPRADVLHDKAPVPVTAAAAKAASTVSPKGNSHIKPAPVAPGAAAAATAPPPPPGRTGAPHAVTSGSRARAAPEPLQTTGPVTPQLAQLPPSSGMMIFKGIFSNEAAQGKARAPPAAVPAAPAMRAAAAAAPTHVSRTPHLQQLQNSIMTVRNALGHLDAAVMLRGDIAAIERAVQHLRTATAKEAMTPKALMDHLAKEWRQGDAKSKGSDKAAALVMLLKSAAGSQCDAEVQLLGAVVSTLRKCAWHAATELHNLDMLAMLATVELSPVILALKGNAPRQLVIQLAASCVKFRKDRTEADDEATALGWAMRQGRMDLLRELLPLIDPRLPAEGDMPPLHHAAEIGDDTAAAVLLDPCGKWWMAHGLTVQELLAQPHEGQTPLYRAVAGRHVGLVRQLVAAGAAPLEPVSADGYKDTPVHLAVYMKQVDILRLLLENCKVATRPDCFGSAAVDESQAQLNRAVDGERQTALMLAQRERHIECVGLLLEAGANPTLLRDTASGGGGGKGGKKGGMGGGGAGGSRLMMQNARLRGLLAAKGGVVDGTEGASGKVGAAGGADGTVMPAPASSSSSSSTFPESVLSRALEDGVEDVLRVILECWRPCFNGSALKPELGPAACNRVRAWLKEHARVTLWPTVKALTDLADASPSGVASPSWLSAPLLELLLELCNEASGRDWRACDGASWQGPDGTGPLPRLVVWGVMSGAVVGTAPPPGPVPTFVTPALLKELLRHGVASLTERVPAGATRPRQLQEGSSLLHLVCFTGDVAMLEVLLAAGADIGCMDDLGNTPIHVAAACPHREEVAEQLLRALSAGTAQTKEGQGPRHEQQQQGKEHALAMDLATAEAAVAAGEARLQALTGRNKNGLRPQDMATSRKVKKLLQQLQETAGGALQSALKALQERQGPRDATSDAAKEVVSKAATKKGNADDNKRRKGDGGGSKGVSKSGIAATGVGDGPRVIRSAADLADDEALRSAALAQLVAVPEPLVLPLASKLVKLLPANLARGGPHAGAGSDGGAAAAADTDAANAATNRELQRIVAEMRVNCGEEDGDEGVEGDDAAAYSDDDAPPPGEALVDDEVLLQLPARGASGLSVATATATASTEASTTSAPATAASAVDGESGEHPLRGLAWRFVITRQAYEAWGRLPDVWRRLVMSRLRVIGSGYWARCRGAKKITADDPTLAQQELWRLKVTKGGRILFEVAVEYDEESRTWAEMIRLWFITLSHKAYEDMIGLVQASFRRTLAMRERLRLQPIPQHEAPMPSPLPGGRTATASAAAAAGRTAQRLPRHYREAGKTTDGEAAAANSGGGKTRGSRKTQQQMPPAGDLREHFPPASWAVDTYTLMKFYNLDSFLVAAVLQGLETAKVDFPFKLSPEEYDLITLAPNPPSSIILLGRSGTGKTTCAVYRLWANWLRHYTNPGLDPVHAVFVTASATLRERVALAFRRLQSAVMAPAEFARVVAVANATYHTFHDVPSDAFPLFLSSRAFLRILDGSTGRPFFPRQPNGAILQLPDDGEELDPDGAALVVALDEDVSDDEDEVETETAAGNQGAGDGGAAGPDSASGNAEDTAAGGVVALEEEMEAAAAAAAAVAARAAALADLEAGGGDGHAASDSYGLGVAGRARLNREVTYQYFVNSMWKKITTPDQRDSVAPGLVYQEILSYLKGSAEAIASPAGHLSLPAYLALGRKRAPNFSEEIRKDLVWPIFEKYERLKRHEWRYDLLDLVGHVYREMSVSGYTGTPIHALYRDEVQDFTQGELLLDLAVAADPNTLFYCGDTAQTIARGIGFRFTDICTLFYEENQRRQQQQLQQQMAAAAAAAAAAEDASGEGRRKGALMARRGHGVTVATPPIHQLTMNYRTHQGVLDVAALVVDVLRRYFPRQLDRLERERALFPGPHPLLLGGISSDDLAILLSGSDRNTSQVEFGAHQVILVRTMASVAQLPQDIQDSNAIIMTVPQAKGLEFDDVFIVDFFNDSDANSEWRVLSSYLAELAGTGGVGAGDGYQYDMQQANAGAVRPLAFDERSHVLLAEELKHLYTALTRAKNNVVIFDRNPTKRAPFYHLLQSLGIARTVHRSLLEDGRDAVRYGLTQQATSSRAEWAKRARNLLDNRNYLMAKKAFVQAADMVRTEVAEAYLKRRRAADEESPTEQRRLLAGAALQLLAAASRREQSPDPVTAGELRRWLGLAGRCLQACGLAGPAAELAFKAGNHTAALRVLLAGKEHAAAAECCLDAAAEALRQHAVYQRQHLAEGGSAAAVVALLESLVVPPAGTAVAAAAAARKRALAWLAKAVEQVYLANDLETLTALLAPAGANASGANDSEDDELGIKDDGRGAAAASTGAPTDVFAMLVPELHDMLRRRWVSSYGRALQRVALRCHARGEHGRARRMVRLMPVEAERDALLARMGDWREQARLKRLAANQRAVRRSSDPLGAAQLLLDNGDFERAARLVSDYIASKAPAPQQPQAKLNSVPGGAGGRIVAARGVAAVGVDAVATAWAPVEERAWDLVYRCIMAQTDAAGARRLRRELDRWAVAAAGTPEAALGSAVSSSPSAGQAGRRVLLYRGHAVLLEARLLLQPWVSAGGVSGAGGVGVGTRNHPQQSVPASWEQLNDEAVAAWEAAAPLLREAADCFSRCEFWPGHLEALTLMLMFGPESDAADAAVATAAAAAAITSATSVPGSASDSPRLRQADGAAAFVRTVQAVVEAFHASGPWGLTKLQGQHLVALEQLYGLPGLSRWDERLPAKQATHVWWAVLGPDSAAAARAAATAASAGSASLAPRQAVEAVASAAAQRAIKGLSYAAAAAKGVQTTAPPPQVAAAAAAVPPLATTRQLLTHQLGIAARQAVPPDAAGTMQRSAVVAELVRDLAVKAACVSFQALRSAIDTYLAIPSETTLPPATSKMVLAALRPVVRSIRVSRAALALLNAAEADFGLYPVTTYQEDLLQPPLFYGGPSPPPHGELLKLLLSESLQKMDLHEWIKEAIVFSDALNGRLALAPTVSYTAWRTTMLVLMHDELAGRVFKLRRARLPPDVPASRMIRDRENTALPEYVLHQAFLHFSTNLPHKAIGDLLYYLAWCCRRDGLLVLSWAASSTAAAAGAVAATGGAAVPASAGLLTINAAQGSSGAPSAPVSSAAGGSARGRCLALEAYVELTELAVGQLLLAACDNAFLSGNIAGKLAGLPKHRDHRLSELALRWLWALGFRPPTRPSVAPGLQRGLGNTTQEYFRYAKVAQEALGKQLLLCARLVMVLAGHLGRLLVVAEQGEGQGTGGGGFGAGGTANAVVMEELLPLLEAPSIAAALELMGIKGNHGGEHCASVAIPSPVGATPSARGPRLIALARRILLAAGSAWLSLEVQKRMPQQQLPQQQHSAAAVAAELQDAAATRGRWPTDVVPLFREAVGLLAEPLVGAAAIRVLCSDLTLSGLADQLRQLAAAWNGHYYGSMLLVDARADREFEGFGPQHQAKQFKGLQGPLAALYTVVQARVQGPSAMQQERAVLTGAKQAPAQAADVPVIAGLLRSAAEAVGVVASKDYRSTRDELTKQSAAAAIIQRSWRQWRRRREEAAAAAQQRQREEAALRQLREGMSFGLRIALRVYLSRLRRSIEKRKQQEAQGNGQDGQWDEFGFAAVEASVQEGEKRRFIDESSCPVCQPKSIPQEQQQQQLWKEEQEQQSQQQSLAVEDRAACGSSGSKLNLSLTAAVAEFLPHKSRTEHQTALHFFRLCHAKYRETVSGLVRHAQSLLKYMEQVQGQLKADPEGSNFLVIVMESSMQLDTALKELCDQLHKIVAERLWMTSPQLLGPKWYACMNACDIAASQLNLYTTAYRREVVQQFAQGDAQQQEVARQETHGTFAASQGPAHQQAKEADVAPHVGAWQEAGPRQGQQAGCTSNVGMEAEHQYTRSHHGHQLQYQQPAPPVPHELLNRLKFQEGSNVWQGDETQQQLAAPHRYPHKEPSVAPSYQSQLHGQVITAHMRQQQEYPMMQPQPLQPQLHHALQQQLQQQLQSYQVVQQQQQRQQLQQGQPYGSSLNAWAAGPPAPAAPQFSQRMPPQQQRMAAGAGAWGVRQMPGVSVWGGIAGARPQLPNVQAHGAAQQAYAARGPAAAAPAPTWASMSSTPMLQLMAQQNQQQHHMLQAPYAFVAASTAPCRNADLSPGLIPGGGGSAAAATGAMPYMHIMGGGGAAAAATAAGSGLRTDDELLFPDESATSFGSLPVPKLARYAWMPTNDKVNNENFHKMLEEYRATKKRERELELKIKQLGAQLARTEEAAKRALVQTDASAKGGAAQKLLDAERAIAKLRAENAELASKLAREKKKSAEFKTLADTYKQRLDRFLRDQRNLVKRVGELERSQAVSRKRPEDDYWGEEAGRRFVAQQEELVALKEENAALKRLMESDGPLAQCKAYEGQINELQNLIRFYERKLTSLAEAGLIGPEALGGPDNQPGPDDWVLEEFWHNDEMHLLDRKNGKLFTVPGDNNWPKPIGIRINKDIKMGVHNGMERFLGTLDAFLTNNAARLQEVFTQFDLDNSGQLDRRELARLLQTLMPDLSMSQVAELRTMLDVDGDGLITLEEMLECIKEAYAARTAAKLGKSVEVNDALDRIRDTLRENKQAIKESFDELDTDKDGCLTHMEVVRLVRRFLKDMYQKEVRYLLARLQQWDVVGDSRVTFDELYQAMELVRIFRVGPGLGGVIRTSSPLRSPPRTVSPTKPRGGTIASAHGLRPSLRSTGGGAGMKETWMRERMTQLETELRDANRRNAELEDGNKKLDELQRDVALYKARIEELERDFMRIDVLGNLEGAAGDEQLQKAWEIASTFKKRFMEHKGELDNIRLMYARMQAQLDETHKLLHEEHRKRFKLEDEITRLNVELMRLGDLEARLAHEKGERVKLEREYLALQQKALNAPGEALAEVRALREELFAVKREKATAQQKEAEVRLELSHVRALLDGMNLESYRTMQGESDTLKKRIASLTLELQAARDKLAVYMRTALPNSANADLLLEDDDLLFGSDKRPDSDKTPEELRRELMQLRDVLETESAITMEAKAALEEAHRELERVKRELQADLKKLEREIERRDEKIRKLELQLRGAYSGINRALRSSRRGGVGTGELRDSLRSDTDDFSEIGEDQNIFELHITEAQVNEEALGKDPSVFFTFDFFMHETQATPIMASNSPSFNTIIQYVVDNDPFLLEYMDTHVLVLDLCRARGYDYDVLGMARLPLRQVLEDLEIGAALGYNRAYHYADVFGADGKRLGRVRYGYCFRRPLDSLLKEYRVQARTKRPSDPDERDPATQAVQLALSQPGNNSCIKVIIERCEQLVPAGGTALTIKPYVHYRFPGTRDYHDTRILAGTSPVFNDEAVWPITRTPELEADLLRRHLSVVVFDDAQGDDPLRAIVGVASIPMASLASGIPVEGAFKLTNPVNRKPAGRMVLGLGWHNPLQLPGATPRVPPPRVPISSEVQDGESAHDFGLPHDAKELLPVSGGLPPGGFGGRMGVRVANPGSGLLPGHQPPSVLPRQYENRSLAAELGSTGSRAVSSQGYGLAAEQHLQPQQRSGYGNSAQSPLRPQPQRGADFSGFGLAVETASQHQQQLNQQPPTPYLGAPPHDQEFGLDADTRSTGYSQHQQPRGLQPSPYRQQSPYRQGSGGPPSSGFTSRTPSEYGLGAEMTAAPSAAPQPAGHSGLPRTGSWGRPPLPVGSPPPPAGRPGSLTGGRRGQSEETFGLDAEAGSQREVPIPGAWSQLSRQQPVDEGFGLGAELEDAGTSGSPPHGMILSGRGSGSGNNGQRRYADTQVSLESSAAPYTQLQQPNAGPLSQDALLGPVLRRELPDPAAWSELDHRLVLCLHALELTPQALRNPRLRNVVLMHSLLSEQEGISELDTCTQPVAKGPGQLQIGYCVSYNVLAGAAPSELLDALAGGDDFMLEVKLMSTAASRLDMNSIAQPGTLQTLGSCMLPLADIWSGRRGDLMQERVEILDDSDDTTQVAVLTVSLVAEAALHTLRQRQH